MKLANMILILVILQGAIMMYDQVYDTTSYTLESYDDNETSIWEFVSDPTGWNNTVLIVVLLGLGVGAAAFIVVGTFLNTPSDTAIFAPVFTILIAAGMIPIISLYQVFNREPTLFGCATIPCPASILAWLFTGGIIGIFYVLAVLEWWSGRSTG